MRFFVILGLVLAVAACARSDDGGSSARVRGPYIGSGVGANIVQ
jgi:hypothetical protein